MDWTGNKRSVSSVNMRRVDAADNDYYATDPKAVEVLLEKEKFNHYIWECACGGGHISKVLESYGYDVKSSDIIDRGFNGTEIIDFLKCQKKDIELDYQRDIITNPPYKFAKEFVEHALDISTDHTKVAMFLKLTFLEGKARKELFLRYPPKTVYVSSSRMNCGKNGEFDSQSSAVAYAWYIWEKGFKGDPVIKWIN